MNFFAHLNITHLHIRNSVFVFVYRKVRFRHCEKNRKTSQNLIIFLYFYILRVCYCCCFFVCFFVCGFDSTASIQLPCSSLRYSCKCSLNVPQATAQTFPCIQMWTFTTALCFTGKVITGMLPIVLPSGSPIIFFFFFFCTELIRQD